MIQELNGCKICPRNCGADRLSGKTGYCLTDDQIRIGRAALHFWEEPCISGIRGTGAIFFTGCNLRCVFCQNRKISNGKIGQVITVSQLADRMLQLEQEGAHSIDLVTPTHYGPQVCLAIEEAKKRGLHIPFVYNTSGYEKVESLRKMDGLIDIYLPDFKYMSAKLAERYSMAADYPIVAMKAIEEMVRQTGSFHMGQEGILERGVIVRHMLLPGCGMDSKKILEYLYKTYGNSIMISILNQYTPVGQLDDYPNLQRKVTKREYKRLVDYAIELGIQEGYIQEGETQSESFIPEFGEENDNI